MNRPYSPTKKMSTDKEKEQRVKNLKQNLHTFSCLINRLQSNVT